jgi:hypothetical protein
MIDVKFSTILRITIVPQVVDMIVKECGVNELDATNMFYRSQTYKYLSDEETKMWHFSPLTIFNIWKVEKETGEVIFPEEGLL